MLTTEITPITEIQLNWQMPNLGTMSASYEGSGFRIEFPNEDRDTFLVSVAPIGNHRHSPLDEWYMLNECMDEVTQYMNLVYFGALIPREVNPNMFKATLESWTAQRGDGTETLEKNI